MNWDSTLLAKYAKLLVRLHSIALTIFYKCPNLSLVPSVVNAKITEAVRVHKTQLVDYKIVKQRHILSYKRTLSAFLPLLPCRHILTVLCTYWNSIKCGWSDYTNALVKKVSSTKANATDLCNNKTSILLTPLSNLSNLSAWVTNQFIIHPLVKTLLWESKKSYHAIW